MVEKSSSKSPLHPKIVAKRGCYNRYAQYIDSEEFLEGIIAPIREYWITNILDLIPANYKDLDLPTMEKIIDDVLNEINKCYYHAVKKSILDYILKEDSEKLRIGILQRFDEPEEYGEGDYKGVIIDSDWVSRVAVSKQEIKKNLVNYCQATLSIINVWAPISSSSYFDLPQREEDKDLLSDFISKQRKKISGIVKKIKENWIPDVAKIYQKDLEDMSKEEIFRFFKSSKILMSSQLRELVYKSLRELREFIKKYDKKEILTPVQ